MKRAMKHYKLNFIVLPICITFLFPVFLVAQNELFQVNQTYDGVKATYAIEVPKSFTKMASEENIDLKFGDDYGASIIVNITPRQKEEYQITAHNYSKEIFENSLKQILPNIKIHTSEKITVAGENAFIMEMSGLYNSQLKSVECHFFKDQYAFVITGTAKISSFDNYRQLFKNVIRSLTFN